MAKLIGSSIDDKIYAACVVASSLADKNPRKTLWQYCILMVQMEKMHNLL